MGWYRPRGSCFHEQSIRPRHAFVSGPNTMTITVISGSASLGGYLNPGYSYDCVELY